MADETTTTGTTQATGIALDGQPSANNADATTAQESAEAKRLAELEKQLQQIRSQQGREAAALKAQAADAQRRAQEAENRAHQVAMANMDELQQAKYLADLNGRRVQELQAQLETQQLAQVRFERITAMSQETGVPFEELNKAQEPEDMVRIVSNYYKQQADGRIDQEVTKRTAKKEANSVDLGGGGGKRSPSGIEEKFKAALATGDVREIAKLRYRLQQQE